jgi:hypothetical protein
LGDLGVGAAAIVFLNLAHTVAVDQIDPAFFPDVCHQMRRHPRRSLIGQKDRSPGAKIHVSTSQAGLVIGREKIDQIQVRTVRCVSGKRTEPQEAIAVIILK